jgi:hypothetical protein
VWLFLRNSFWFFDALVGRIFLVLHLGWSFGSLLVNFFFAFFAFFTSTVVSCFAF